jgi:hypothetical protein
MENVEDVRFLSIPVHLLTSDNKEMWAKFPNLKILFNINGCRRRNADVVAITKPGPKDYAGFKRDFYLETGIFFRYAVLWERTKYFEMLKQQLGLKNKLDLNKCLEEFVEKAEEYEENREDTGSNIVVST